MPDSITTYNTIKILIKHQECNWMSLGYFDKKLVANITPVIDEAKIILVIVKSVIGTNLRNGYLRLNFRYLIIKNNLPLQ